MKKKSVPLNVLFRFHCTRQYSPAKTKDVGLVTSRNKMKRHENPTNFTTILQASRVPQGFKRINLKSVSLIWSPPPPLPRPSTSPEASTASTSVAEPPSKFADFFFIESKNITAHLYFEASSRLRIKLCQKPGPRGSGASRTSPRSSTDLREVPPTATPSEGGGFRPLLKCP